jgi:hypothetical protein
VSHKNITENIAVPRSPDVQERYCLPHEVAAEDVDVWGRDRHF